MSLSNSSNPTPQHDAFNQWMQKFQSAYTLTDASIKELDLNNAGVLIKPSGTPLQVRKITAEMLKDNLNLANEVHQLAMKGFLGFASKDSPEGAIKLQFHKNIGDRLQANTKVQVVDHQNPENIEHLDVGDTLNHEDYSNLVGINFTHLDLEESHLEEKEKKELEKSDGAEKLNHKHSHNTNPNTTTKNISGLVRLRNSTKDLFSSLLQNFRDLTKKQVENAREAREAGKKRVREHEKVDDLKREELNRVIKNTEISKVEEHKDVNFSKEIKS